MTLTDPKVGTKREHLTLHERWERNAQEQRRRMLASQRLCNAVYKGKIIRQACEVCGEAKTEGHHFDYSKPLEVRWLCHKHHVAEHVRLRAEERSRAKELPPQPVHEVTEASLARVHEIMRKLFPPDGQLPKARKGPPRKPYESAAGR